MTTAETYILTPTQTDPTVTHVALPRFQVETETSFASLATDRPWLSPDVVELHLNANELPGAFRNLNKVEDHKRTNHWVGNVHIAKRRDSRFLDIEEVSTPPLETTRRVWLTGYHHLLAATPDSPNVIFTELVLKGFEDYSEQDRPCGRLVEFAALLINEENRLQQLVIQGPNGWHEPRATAEDAVRANTILATMARISEKELHYATATTVDNRGHNL